MFTRWDMAVELAKDVAADCEGGRVDISRVARLARTIVEFQQGLLGHTSAQRRTQDGLASAR